jgi:hypothetical protein
MFTAMRISSSYDETSLRQTNAAINTHYCIRQSYAILILLILIAFQMLIMANTKVHNYVVRTPIMIVPPIRDWKARLNCVKEEEKCEDQNWCKMPKIAYMHPPKETVAILALRGTGGSYVSELIQDGMRSIVSSQNCFEPFLFNGMFSLDCSKAFYFRHSAMTRFFSINSLTDETGFNPTKLVLLVRNPFDAILAAYRFYSKCELGLRSGQLCVGSLSGEMGIDNASFSDFAQKYAQLWSLQFDYAREFTGNNTNATKIVFWEDVINNRDRFTTDLFQFTTNEWSPPVDKAVRCSRVRLITPSGRVENYDHSFPSGLKEKVCAHLNKNKHNWNEDKFGKNIC